MPRKPASSSRSRTSEVRIDDKVVGTSEWSLDIRRDYIDASAFGESKTYVAGPPEVTGSFSGVMDVDLGAPPPLDGEDAETQVALYTEKEITRVHAWLLDLLGRDRPQHRFAVGQVTEATVENEVWTATTRSMTLYPDPGTLPAIWRRRLRAKRDELAYRLWDRFLRPTIVIDQDEWQAEEYEAHEEELYYEALERAARGSEDDADEA